jgi:hypothetical protein
VESQAKLLPRGSTAILISTADALSLRQAGSFLSLIGQRPIAIWIDPATFDQGLKLDWHEDSLDSLRSQGIPYFVIRYGDEIGKILSQTDVPIAEEAMNFRRHQSLNSI